MAQSLRNLWKQTKLVLKRLGLTFPSRREIDEQLLLMCVEDMNALCDSYEEISDEDITYV